MNDITLRDLVGTWRLYDLELHRFPVNKGAEYDISLDGRFNLHHWEGEPPGELLRGEVSLRPGKLETGENTVIVNFGSEEFRVWECSEEFLHLEGRSGRICLKRIK